MKRSDRKSPPETRKQREGRDPERYPQFNPWTKRTNQCTRKEGQLYTCYNTRGEKQVTTVEFAPGGGKRGVWKSSRSLKTEKKKRQSRRVGPLAPEKGKNTKGTEG